MSRYDSDSVPPSGDSHDYDDEETGVERALNAVWRGMKACGRFLKDNWLFVIGLLGAAGLIVTLDVFSVIDWTVSLIYVIFAAVIVAVLRDRGLAATWKLVRKNKWKVIAIVFIGPVGFPVFWYAYGGKLLLRDWGRSMDSPGLIHVDNINYSGFSKENQKKLKRWRLGIREGMSKEELASNAETRRMILSAAKVCGIKADEIVPFDASAQTKDRPITLMVFESVMYPDVLPSTLSIETPKGGSKPIFRRGSTIPTSKSVLLLVIPTYKRFVDVHVLQGELEKAADNKSLGHFVLEGIPRAPQGGLWLNVTFSIDEDGVLDVAAKVWGKYKDRAKRKKKITVKQDVKEVKLEKTEINELFIRFIRLAPGAQIDVEQKAGGIPKLVPSNLHLQFDFFMNGFCAVAGKGTPIPGPQLSTKQDASAESDAGPEGGLPQDAGPG